MITISGPDFITLLVNNLETSYRFYKDQIGLPESSEKQPNAHAFATKPCGLAIRQSPQSINNPGQGITIWLHATDATIMYNEMKKRKVPIFKDIQQSPFGMTFSFKDPDGYIMAVHDAG